MDLKNIFIDCAIGVDHYETVYGGDINQCYGLYTSSENFFLKVNAANRYPGMFEKEARGLRTLRDNCSLLIPEVIKYGTDGEQQYLLLQWLHPGRPNTLSWQSFGAGLAGLHKKTHESFGWCENNFIGSLPQINTLSDNWDEFYARCRIMPLVLQLENAGVFTKKHRQDAESLCKKLGNLFPPEPPSLLHGDFWSGNYMITESGEPAIYDPAVYYGHREMDIGMSLLFGGFESRFYAAYNEAYPLEPAWEARLPLSQLYPLLVHAVLFGGSYVSRCQEILKTHAG